VIVRQFGTKVQRVEPDFRACAMNEIGFRRDGEWSLPTDEFFNSYEKTDTHELMAEAEGDVQSEAEARLLASLEQQLRAVADGAGDGVVLIESDLARDYPKTRHTQTTVVVGGENRFYFRFTVAPPLRVAVYRRK
jgi:hypothetical protein